MYVRLDANDATRVAVLNVLPHGLKGRVLAPLESNLHQALAFLDGVDHRAAFSEVVAQRFLAIDIHSTVQSRQQLKRVPVRRRGNNHRVQVGLEQILVELEGLGAFGLKLLEGVGALPQVLAVDIANANDLHAANSQSRLGILHSVPTAANES
jgi:hypothetical protein